MIQPNDSASSAGHRLFPASRRVYIPGSRADLGVPMREIALSPTRLPNGTEVPNEPVRVYDTSGPWGDPAFHADQAAVYYARVLEIPTPRWTTFLAVQNKLPIPASVPSAIQERAWTSPVFYHP